MSVIRQPYVTWRVTVRLMSVIRQLYLSYTSPGADTSHPQRTRTQRAKHREHTPSWRDCGKEARVARLEAAAARRCDARGGLNAAEVSVGLFDINVGLF